MSLPLPARLLRALTHLNLGATLGLLAWWCTHTPMGAALARWLGGQP